LMEASAFVRTLQHPQDLNVCCPEEIAALLRFISLDELLLSAQKFKNSEYGNYLHSVHHLLSNGSAAHDDETTAKV
jgi:glucose-1-phosphate thymidylyltransferase